MTRIYLVGFMGCGKSYTGKNLARKLGYEFTDLDVMFEHRYRIAISQFFHKYGEAAFRKVEQRLLFETGNFRQVVISTGGGTPCFDNNMDWINHHGLSVYLRMSPSALFHRLSHSRKPRPLIKDLSPDELRRYIRERLASREVYYNQASLVYAAENMNVHHLVEALERHQGLLPFSDQ